MLSHRQGQSHHNQPPSSRIFQRLFVSMGWKNRNRDYNENSVRITLLSEEANEAARSKGMFSSDCQGLTFILK